MLDRPENRLPLRESGLETGRHGAVVLEGDIKNCFDYIDHDWLLSNIPMDKRVLQAWLKAGFMEGGNSGESNHDHPDRRI